MTDGGDRGQTDGDDRERPGAVDDRGRPDVFDDALRRLTPAGPPPADYPGERDPDPHSERPFAATFEARRAAYLEHVRRNPGPGHHLSAAFHEMARLGAGATPWVGVLDAALAFVRSRIDCADFVLHAVLRILYQFPDHPALPPAWYERAREVVLGFKYWPDEPGSDSLCTWTENHQILFASAAMLAAQRHRDDRFENTGETGRQKLFVARARVMRWLDLRFRTGFSEWLSNVYYDEDLVALASLADFAEDDEIRTRAAMVADLVLLDVAHHSFRGVFGSTHGRSYAATKKWAAAESTADVAKLVLGVGRFASRECMSVAALALSPRYRPPAVLAAIAADAARPEVRVRQRMGIRVRDRARHGLDPHDPEDMMVLLSLEAYTHPDTIEGFAELLDRFGWWENGFFRTFRRSRRLLERLRRLRLLPTVARLVEWDVTRNLREEVNTLTYRTPDYALSSAQDWHPGRGGDQQHLWQATLGPDAVCFTTHPGPRRARSPSTWTGSATLPRVGQVDNVLVALYRITRRPALYFPNRKLYTHAWLPRDAFDEVVERAGWVFARRDDGYLALRSQNAAHWQEEPGEDRSCELVAPGRRNVWICELGRRATSGSFESFRERIAAARVRFAGEGVIYDSPSQGRIEFGWTRPLRRRGRRVALRDYPRYESPWARAPFPAHAVDVHCGDHWLRLEWERPTRKASAFGD